MERREEDERDALGGNENDMDVTSRLNMRDCTVNQQDETQMTTSSDSDEESCSEEDSDEERSSEEFGNLDIATAETGTPW